MATNRMKANKPLVAYRFESAFPAQVPIEITADPAQTADLLRVKNGTGVTIFTVPGTGTQNSQVFTAGVALTAVQTKALFSTPITLVAAQGSGRYIVVDSIVAKNVYGTATYAGANALEFRYTDGSGVKVTGDIAAAFINIASGTRVDIAVGAAAAVAVANAAVVVCVPTANPTNGDGILSFTVYYRVITP